MEIGRRDFLTGAGSAALVGATALRALASTPKEIHAVWLHLGMNMWCDWRAPGEPVAPGRRYSYEEVFFDERIWRDTIDYAVKKGCNCVVMDLGEFVSYPSHPEIGIKGSWSAERLRNEVRRVRTLGLEPIPSLNFSATHDSWLGEYHRMLSTRTYYKVCADILKDVCEIFDCPRMIHIGFDEECYRLQSSRGVVTIRQNEMWWHDLYWFVNQVEKLGMRAIMAADHGWNDMGQYVKKCPKTVIQQNWYYNQDAQGYVIEKMEPKFRPQMQLYLELEKAGFDQLPCVTNWLSERARKAGLSSNEENAGKIIEFCRANIADERLLGFVVASWADTKGVKTFKFNCKGIDCLTRALAN